MRRLPTFLSMAMLLNFLLVTLAAHAGGVKVITDISHWQHPVKAVFQKHKVVLYKVELVSQTYPIFFCEISQ
jgi:hypothetical protein